MCNLLCNSIMKCSLDLHFISADVTDLRAFLTAERIGKREVCQLLQSMDSHSYVAPCRLKALLVPIGGISEANFHKYVTVVRSSFEVRLVDVTPTENSLFNPLGFPNGRVMYDFQLSLNDQESLFLHDFEPFRKIFVVIGITDNNKVDKEDILKLSKIYKSSIVHTIIVFDQDSTDDSHSAVHPTDSLIFHQAKSNIETILCDITRIFLSELSAYLKSYQHITLRSPGTVGSNDRIKSIMPQKKKRVSSGSSISRSLSDVSNGKLQLTTPSERRSTKVKGRQQKILGNLFLIAGKYTDALKELSDAVSLLKSSGDHLWLGSALESVGVCIVMLSFLGVPYQVPQVLSGIIHHINSTSSPNGTPNSTPRSSFAINSSSVSIDLSRLTVPELIQEITIKVLHYYELSQNEHEDYVPQLVYCDCILRYVKFMCVLNIGGGLNNSTLCHIVRGKRLEIRRNHSLFDKMEILKFSNKILTVQLKNMDILSQAKIYSTLASIYGDLDLLRRRSFILRTLFVSLIPELQAIVDGIHHPDYNIKDLLDSILYVYGIGSSPESVLTDSFSTTWSQLHISVIKLCIIVCGKIGDNERVILLKSLLITRYHDAITDNEQTKLSEDVQSLARTSDVPYYYWDPYLVRNIQIIKPSNSPTKQNEKISLEKTESLIYNPYVKPAKSQDVFFVQDEFLEFQITLQNPFAFALNISDIQIENMEIFRNHFIIAAKTLTSITVLAKPIKAGTIKIQSVKIKVFDAISQNFKIAKDLNTEVVPKLKKISNSNNFKVLSQFEENLKENRIEQRTKTDTVQLTVIPPQPSIQVTAKTNHIMLLEGGSEKTQIKVKNNSNVAVNYFKISLWDSTIDPLTNVLNNKGLPANEVYEIEYFLYKKPLNVLSEVNYIKPQEEITLDLEVVGKRGMNQVNLILDYGNRFHDSVYTRRTEVPIRVMVNSSTDLAGCDILPLVQKVDSKMGQVWKYINDQSGCKVSDFALFIVDLRNVWNKTMRIDVQYNDFKLKESIVPMETKRLMIPIKRINLNDDTLKVIPSLSNKQFILSKVSKAEDTFIKEAFWYRDEILKRISGKWTVGDIKGDIEFRGVRLSQRMLNVLKVDKIGIDISIKDTAVHRQGLYNSLKIDEFFTIIIKISNNTNKKVFGIVRNIPIASTYASVERKLLFNGVLQKSLSEALSPGDSFEQEIGCVVLDRGEYEWGVVFDELGADYQHISREPLYIRAN